MHYVGSGLDPWYIYSKTANVLNSQDSYAAAAAGSVAVESGTQLPVRLCSVSLPTGGLVSCRCQTVKRRRGIMLR
jgi:hypothetical protein